MLPFAIRRAENASPNRGQPLGPRKFGCDIVITSALALFWAQAIPVAAADVVEPPDPKEMSQADIRAFNAKLPRDHPHYIRCERRDETGSLVKKLYSCRTNEQWQKADQIGNDNVREMGDHFQPKFLNRG